MVLSAAPLRVNKWSASTHNSPFMPDEPYNSSASLRNTVWGGLLFLILILALNANLFHIPFVEISDYAVNSLQVQQARHFRLLVGHYSRFHFHHPGPAYLYIFGLGEFLFHDILRVVPAPFNGQIVMTIVLNVALLTAVFSIFTRRLGGVFSVPLALAATTVVTVMVNRSAPPSMLISNWMPDVLLFSFLLFVVGAASILAGETRDLPFLALSGMLLIHSHVAQFLFVGLIGMGTVSAVCWPALRARRLGSFLWERRRHFGGAAAICFLFALPPVLDAILNRPSNIDDIRAYLRLHAEHNSVILGLRYLFCFLTFVGWPESVLSDPNDGIVRQMLSHPSAMVYWVAFLAFSSITGVLVYRDANRPPLPPFLKNLAWVTIASGALFVFWGTRITGGLFAFNGRFIFSLHLLAWFPVLAVLSRYLTGRRGRIVTALAVVFTVTLAYGQRHILRPALPDIPDAVKAAPKIQVAGTGIMEITFPHDDWPWAASLANAMQRIDKRFCVDESWGFMFSRQNVCPDPLRTAKLEVAAIDASDCTPPCLLVYRGKRFSVRSRPAWLSLPVEIGFSDPSVGAKAGFNNSEGAYCWTRKHSTIRFLLTPELPKGACFQLEVRGFTAPGRPARVALNADSLGTLARQEPAAASFIVPRGILRPGEINTVAFDTEKAGPAGGDHREIGFGFISLALRSFNPGEACPSDSTGEPAYSLLATNRSGGPADFNGDGHPDLVWQYPGPGQSQIWFLGGPQGAALLGAASLSNVTDWRIAAVADLNGDGHPDVIWQHPASGESKVWFLGGLQGNIIGGETTLTPGQPWRIVAAADFNRDGHPDLVWQDPASGRARIWYLGGPQGTTLMAAVDLARISPWHIVGAGDFNGDGYPDLVWQDPVSGAVQVWYLGGPQGNTVTAVAQLAGLNSWRIVSIADFNLDGHPDVVWQNPTSGASQIWFLGGAQGTTLLGNSDLSGPNIWRIAGPR